MSDKYIEKFAQLSSVHTAYMRDVTHPMHHEIQSMSPGDKVIGRAFTVSGPDIYLNALETIAEESVYVHAAAGPDGEDLAGGGVARPGVGVSSCIQGGTREDWQPDSATTRTARQEARATRGTKRPKS